MPGTALGVLGRAALSAGVKHGVVGSEARGLQIVIAGEATETIHSFVARRDRLLRFSARNDGLMCGTSEGRKKRMKQPCKHIMARAGVTGRSGRHRQPATARFRAPRGAAEGLLGEIWLQDIGLVRVARDHDRSDRKGEADQGWEPREENSVKIRRGSIRWRDLYESLLGGPPKALPLIAGSEATKQSIYLPHAWIASLALAMTTIYSVVSAKF